MRLKQLRPLLGCALSGVALFAAQPAGAVVIDFTGGTATLSDGSTVTPNNFGYWSDVKWYEEDGIRVTFNGSYGIIGDYYSIGSGGFVGNDVIHAHWQDGVTSITFEKIDGQAFDLTYFDLTSNTVVGGGQSDGSERSYITPSGGPSMLLPSSDWGFDVDYFGNPGDGIARLYPDSSFLGITSFTVTSENAYCFGLDNFYIDQAAPPIPEPTTWVLMLAGLAGVAGAARTRKASQG